MSTSQLKYSLLIFTFLFSTPLLSQVEKKEKVAFLAKQSPKKKKNLFQKVLHLFEDVDTNYIAPNNYNYAFMIENSNFYERYSFSSTQDSEQYLSIEPKVSNKLGLYFGWKFIFLGYSVDIEHIFGGKSENRRREFELSLYSSIIGCDIYSRKSGTNFSLRNISDFYPGYQGKLDKSIKGITVDVEGINLYFIFNHKKFSYRAAYSQSTNQKRSAGSFMAGICLSRHDIHFDYQKLPEQVKNQLDDGLKFERIKYYDYNISAGYGYNWVFAKNWLFNATLMPAIGYKQSNLIKSVTPESIINNLNFDFITRLGLTYNNSKYFVGATLFSHTYDYKSKDFGINNNFVTLRVYLGFNFWKKK